MFEDEIFDMVRQFDCHVNIGVPTFLPPLKATCLYIPDKGIVLHLITIPFLHNEIISSDYFQKMSFIYAAQGIQLINLWQDLWVKRPDIVRSRIAALFGKSKHIHARQTKVQRINRADMRAFLDMNHLQGAVTARYSYGLFLSNLLVAVASFSSGRIIPREGIPYHSFELLRYASLLNHRVVGGMGKLLSCFTADVHPGDIMTYADLDWGYGKGYQTLGFQQTAITPPQIFWIHPNEKIRYYPHRLPKKLTDDFYSQNCILQMDNFLLNYGYIRIYNSGNLKYLKINDPDPKRLSNT